MIVWLASYPRSGNTLLRIAMNRTYGVRSSVVYDHDGVADRLGAAFVGLDEQPGSDACAQTGGPTFIKTHRQRDARVAEDDAAICIVRDGRDALVSYARLLTENTPEAYEAKLRELIEQNSPTGTGGWGGNVLSWLRRPQQTCVILRFEDLSRDPAVQTRRAMNTVAPSLAALPNPHIPSFDDLARLDPGFFRRGRAGAWREEMPEQLHDLFWSYASNSQAMQLLRYG